jgi:sugar phosphate isomerase/epimerase
MVHMHVKDGRIVNTPDQGPQPQWCVVGEGEIDYAGHFAALRRDGYTGYVSLETHYIPKTGRGEGGKGLPEDGSRPCLAALQRFLA